LDVRAVSGDRLANITASHVDSDELGRAGGLGAEGPGHRRPELFGEEPVGVRPGLAQRDDPEPAVARGTDVRISGRTSSRL
jgi:hypothetical protein